MGTNNNGMIILIIIIALVILVGLPIYIKKKRIKDKKAIISSRKNKDEVWKSVKKYLKDSNQYGNEIIDSYVAKRPALDYIDPNLAPCEKRKLSYVNKIREYQYKIARKQINQNTSNTKFVRPPIRDLYVVCFTTKNTKTNEIYPPQAIECEVVVKKIDKKTQDRQIFINGKLNYDKEMYWIAPIKNAELERMQKIEAKNNQRNEKLKKRLKKKEKNEK